MRDDPVYAGFVLPGWRADRERAEAAARQADAEARRADAETRRADAEAQAKREAVDRADAEARRADAEAQARQRLEHDLAALRARLEEGRMR